MLSYSLPFIGHCRPCNSRADSYLSHIVSFLFHAQNTHQIISPGLRRTLWLVPSWSLMNSGQSSSNSCPMFRIAEITWLQGLSRWAIRDDLEEKSTTPSKIFDSYHLFRYLLIPYTEVGWSLTPLHSWTFTRCNFEKSPNLTSAIGPRVLKIFSFTASCNSWRAFFIFLSLNVPWNSYDDRQAWNLHHPALLVVVLQDRLRRTLLLRIFSQTDLGVHRARFHKLIRNISSCQRLNNTIDQLLNTFLSTCSRASRISNNRDSGILVFSKPLCQWWKVFPINSQYKYYLCEFWYIGLL